MRYALIDNSSLTGIQRLLGEIPVKNEAIVDNDIIAFENYIQAILFYDQIICIDDYKPQFRTKRTSYFDDIRFIPKDYFEYDLFVSKAIDVTNDISLEIRGGQVSDKDFKDYLDRLQMTFQFTWDVSSSKYFLAQRMLLGNSILNKEQFETFYGLLFKENNEQYEVQSGLVEKPPKLYDHKGNEIKFDPESGKVSSGEGDGLTGQFQALVASLNWISQRTAFYVLVADYLQADLFLQPLRQGFLQNIIKRVYPAYSLGVFTDFRNSINHQSVETVKNILNTSRNFGVSLDVPLFSAFLAMKTGDSNKIVPAAYEMRNKKPFVQARKKLRELNILLQDGERGKHIREINLLTGEITKTFEKIESKYGVGANQGTQIKFLFSFIPLLRDFEIPDELNPRIKQLEFMKHILPGKGLKAVYRNVIEDLVEFEGIGKHKDVLLKNVKYHPASTYYGIRTEDPKYVRAYNFWKKPM